MAKAGRKTNKRKTKQAASPSTPLVYPGLSTSMCCSGCTRNCTPQNWTQTWVPVWTPIAPNAPVAPVPPIAPIVSSHPIAPLAPVAKPARPVKAKKAKSQAPSRKTSTAKDEKPSDTSNIQSVAELAKMKAVMKCVNEIMYPAGRFPGTEHVGWREQCSQSQRAIFSETFRNFGKILISAAKYYDEDVKGVPAADIVYTGGYEWAKKLYDWASVLKSMTLILEKAECKPSPMNKRLFRKYKRKIFAKEFMNYGALLISAANYYKNS